MLESFRSRLARMIAPQAPGQRRFDAASSANRWSGTPHFGPVGPEVLAAAGPVRSRARYFAANNPWAASGVNALVTALVGSGIVPASTHADAATRKVIGATFTRWANVADADGLTDFWGLEAAAVRSLIIDGEAFLQIITTAAGVSLRQIPAEMVDASHNVELGDGRRIVAGVEFDATGRRVAYHISPVRPTDTYSNYAPPVRVPADEVIHLFRPIGSGQVRGISWLAPVLLRLGELDQLEDALLVGAKVAAMHAGFLVDQNGTGQSPYEGDQTGSVLESGLEPGTLRYLPAGFDIKFSTPQQAQQTIEFAQLQLRAVAAGLGVPEHLLTGDLRAANYSSLRAGLVAFRQQVEQTQFHTIIPQFVRPVWERVLTFAVLSDELAASDLSDVLPAEFYPPAQPWVDPLKDAEAEALLVSKGFKSRRQVVAAQGFNVEDLDAEIASDREREASLGLAFDAAPSSPAAPAKDSPADAS
jgi:lambda family phage portal protein